MPTAVVDGNDPEASYAALVTAMEYVRREKKPYLLEAMVSRLRGHSSASGANLVKGEIDCLDRFEGELERAGQLTRAEMAKRRDAITAELLEASRRIRNEPQPTAQDMWSDVFADKNLVGGEG
jgi:2-oxoisovalerate dehydrogenase E1 component alpha subunit